MTLLKSILVATVTAVAALSFADDAVTIGKHIQAEMDKYVAACKKKDYKAADAVITTNFSPTCKIYDMKGTVGTLKAWMAQNDGQMKAMKSLTSLSLRLTNPHLKGNTFTGIEVFSMSGTTANPKSPKKVSQVSVSGTSVVTMEKKNGKWLVTKRADKTMKMMMDGKPFNPPVAN